MQEKGGGHSREVVITLRECKRSAAFSDEKVRKASRATFAVARRNHYSEKGAKCTCKNEARDLARECFENQYCGCALD